MKRVLPSTSQVSAVLCRRYLAKIRTNIYFWIENRYVSLHFMSVLTHS
jgi:hypothetical protein